MTGRRKGPLSPAVPSPTGGPRRFRHRRAADPLGRIVVLEVVPRGGGASWLLFFALRGATGDVADHRRLAPVPADWSALDDDALEALFERATPVAGPAPHGPPPAPAPPPTVESLAEELEFTRALLAAANDHREHLRRLHRAAEAELEATRAELASMNAELQSLHEGRWR